MSQAPGTSAPPLEISALGKHACPACGAEAEWNPGKQALVCPYCGAVSPAKLADDGSVIEEHDLAAQRPLAVRHLRGLLGLRLADADPVARGARRGARPRQHQAATTRIDPETAAQLRALGYLID